MPLVAQAVPPPPPIWAQSTMGGGGGGAVPSSKQKNTRVLVWQLDKWSKTTKYPNGHKKDSSNMHVNIYTCSRVAIVR